MLSGKLWPAHPHPLPGEILSSWITRLAEANAIKLQTLSRLLFGPELIPWNRDIDRLAPDWLLLAIHDHTGISMENIFTTTLASYEGILFPKRHVTGQLPWILPVKHHGTKILGFSMQFCPHCLQDDTVPYFRKAWRIASFTFCPRHNSMLRQNCIECGSPVVYHRHDFGQELDTALPIEYCFQCRSDLRSQKSLQPEMIDQDIYRTYKRILTTLDDIRRDSGKFNLEYFQVLHQLCRLMMSPNENRLRENAEVKIGIARTPSPTLRYSIESRTLEERYYIISLGIWYLSDLQARITEAWRTKKIRYNLLHRDFHNPPEWYVKMFCKFNTRK